MNLTTDPWIPIVWDNGEPGAVSLQDAFRRGHQIQDLTLRPHERVAITRLLICIAQAALDGPRDPDEWKACFARLSPSAVQYLSHWRQVFELFGTAQRFLQVPNLKATISSTDDGEEGNATSKLDLALATGNNPTLFDNAGGAARGFAPGQLALMVATFQCFSPGGRIGAARWSGKPTAGNGSSNHAPCLAGGMLHTLLRGDNLLATLHRNLLNKMRAEQLFGNDGWGRPVWELMPQSLDDAKAVQNATRTYLGRLVPLARANWLREDGRFLILANGLEYGSYADGWREPSATITTRTVKGQPTRVVLRASIEKGVWRELHALTVKAVGQNPGGALALDNMPDDEKAFDIWVGGLVANKAKLVDSTESVFHVPGAMLRHENQRVYEDGVKHAEAAEFRLRRAVSAYHKKLGDDLDRAEMKDRRAQVQRKASVQFWTDIEQAVPALLEVVETPGALGLQGDWRATTWGQSVRRAARSAFEHACPHGTPRQFCAYSVALDTLFGIPAGRAQHEKEVEG